MLHLELIEESRGNNLQLSEYLPPATVPATSGELWMNVIGDGKPAYKVCDVVPGQRVPIPLVGDAPVRLYLVSHDPTGLRLPVDLTAAVIRDVYPNRESRVPVIEQSGSASLDLIQIGIKNFSSRTRFRKIQVSTLEDFSDPDEIEETLREFDAILNVFPAVENITREDDLETEETRWVRVAHSSNGVEYGEWSNVLGITFEPEFDAGIPTLADSTLDPIPAIQAESGKFWNKDIPPAVQNGYYAKYAQFRLLNGTKLKTLDGSIDDNDISMTLNNVTGLPPSGKVYMFSGEVIGYNGISGNTLQNLERGIEGSIALAGAHGSSVHWIQIQGNISDGQPFFYPQLQETYIVHYRRRNNFGFSLWGILGTAYGYGDMVNLPPEVPPPPPPSLEPPPVYEDDPTVMPVSGRIKNDPSIITL